MLSPAWSASSNWTSIPPSLLARCLRSQLVPLNFSSRSSGHFFYELNLGWYLVVRKPRHGKFSQIIYERLIALTFSDDHKGTRGCQPALIDSRYDSAFGKRFVRHQH